MSVRPTLSSFSTAHLFAKGTGVLGLGALLVLACNGRLAVLDPPITEGGAGSGGSSSTPDLVNHTGGSGAPEPVADAGVATPEPDAAPAPEPSPCSCASSPYLMALGCGTDRVSGVPLISDDGLTVTFDWCDENSVCQPYRWTQAGGMQELPVPSQGGTVSHMSPDGDLLVISPMETFGAEALVYRASDGSSVSTGLRPYYANLVLSANGSVVGLSPGGSRGSAQLARWTRSGGVEVLGTLPFDADNVQLSGTPGAELIVGVNHGPGAGNEVFRWTPGQGLEIEPQDLPPVVNGSAISVSRDGSTLAMYQAGEDSSARIIRWTAAGLIEVGTSSPNWLSPLSMTSDGAVIAGSLLPSNRTCGPNLTGCTSAISAFRWSEGTGAVQLTPGAGSQALALSLDGSLVVGQTYDGVPALFSWTAERGAHNVRADLEALGVDLSGWELSEPRAMAANARVVVGQARCGTGTTIYRLTVPGDFPLPN